MEEFTACIITKIDESHVNWVWWIQCECGLGDYADSRNFVYVKEWWREQDKRM
jgi:hypothetical protein